MSKKKVGSRKNQRKAARTAKKIKKHQHSTINKQTQQSEKGPFLNILQNSSENQKISGVSTKEKKEKGKKSKSALAPRLDDDPSSSAAIAAEDREIERLGRLLGLDSSKKSAAKMNKEYQMYEGIGNNFGNFLMDLDNIGNSAYDGQIFHDDVPDEEDGDIEEVMNFGHIIDDDEQEPDDEDLMPDYVSRLDEEEWPGAKDNSQASSVESNQNEEASLMDDDSELEGDDNSELAEEIASAEEEKRELYRPVEGENIYGRKLVSEVSVSGSKYVPPSRRTQMAAVDDKSEGVQLIRRQMNGLMNRLSDQTKDTIVRDIREIFERNSLTITCNVLKDCIMGACSNPTQTMAGLIPIYASIIAALHFVVGLDVGAYLVESFTTEFNKALTGDDLSKEHSLIGNKLAHNCLLSLIYLYNLRILHHQLITDIMVLLTGDEDSMANSMSEREAELLVCIFDHCGTQLRSDDPVKLGSVFNILTKKSANASASREENSRIAFLLESLTDLKNNKSKRNQSSNSDDIKKMRRWLGGMKTSLNAKPGEYQLRVSLKDLLNAKNCGRWWKAGASWVGNQNGSYAAENKVDAEAKKAVTVSSEERQLLRIAKKMKFNTTTRKNIFVIIMSSRDVNDAFERLARMDLKGKEDREIVRVLVECCGQEKTFNIFYAELASLLCEHNRQFKTTLQFSFWDTFKSLDDNEITERRTINLSLMMAHLVCQFHLPLSVIKPIDMREMNDTTVLYLATFFMALFSGDVPDDTFQSILDRVATTKDFATVRETILLFLKKYLTVIPHGASPESAKGMEKRRKRTIKTMESLSVLDYREQDEGDDDT